MLRACSFPFTTNIKMAFDCLEKYPGSAGSRSVSKPNNFRIKYDLVPSRARQAGSFPFATDIVSAVSCGMSTESKGRGQAALLRQMRLLSHVWIPVWRVAVGNVCPELR